MEELAILWCQLLVFVRLGCQLRWLEHENEFDFNKSTDRAAIGGLLFFNMVAVGLLAKFSVGNHSIVMPWLQILSWSIGFLLTTCLYISIFYSIRKLNQIYPGEAVDQQISTIKTISIMFTVSLIGQLTFEVARVHASRKDLIINLESCLTPVFFVYGPIFYILKMHKDNFS